MKRLAALALSGLILIGAGVACTDKNTEPYNDAPRGGHENSQPTRVIMNADGFSNLGTKCDHGNRIYVAFKGDANRAAVAVSPQDPTCRGDQSTTPDERR